VIGEHRDAMRGEPGHREATGEERARELPERQGPQRLAGGDTLDQAALVPGFRAAPSTINPTDSGESRTTHRQRGSMSARAPTAMSTWVVRHPVVRMSQVTAGTSRLIPVIDALPSTESTTPEAITGPVPASPSGTSTP
jgi:hypothetical protein